MTAENPQYWKKAGDERFKSNDFSGAIHCYSKAIELDSGNNEAWHCLGVSFERLGKYTEAGKCFREERRILGEQTRQKHNPGHGGTIPMHRGFSPVRIVSIGLLLTFLSTVFVMIATYELLGDIDWVATILFGVLAAAIFLGRIFWKRK